MRMDSNVTKLSVRLGSNFRPAVASPYGGRQDNKIKKDYGKRKNLGQDNRIRNGLY